MLFLISLSIPILCSSQTIYQNSKGDTLITITPSQLKTTNLIFVEHKHLKIENNLLNEKITQLELLNSNLNNISTLKDNKLSEYENKFKSQQLTENQLKKEVDKLKQRNKVSMYISGGLGIAVAALLVYGRGN